VLGILEDWECGTGEISIAPRDLLALYTDGVVEAFSDAGEEFGEARRTARCGPPTGRRWTRCSTPW
jgi:serine phosphatase RsbU (regulator of sigma subunit)